MTPTDLRIEVLGRAGTARHEPLLEAVRNGLGADHPAVELVTSFLDKVNTIRALG